MINEIPELLQEDAKFNVAFTPKVPESFNLKLAYPNMVYSREQLRELLKARGLF